MIHIGAVSFFNTKPLIYGLENEPHLRLLLDVPASLLASLRLGAMDIALLPVIDYQRLSGLRLLPVGGIGCDGPTLTVRIFSRAPLEQIQSLACDPDSHTSIALARVILAECYGIHPELVPLDRQAPSQLLIGDKVVREEPAGFPYQLDLGAAWKQLTGLPFVFACWTARAGVSVDSIAPRLAKARIEGLQAIDSILAQHAAPLGWPGSLGRQYLTSYLRYDIGPKQIQAIEYFHQLAWKHGMIDHEPWPVTVG